MLQEFTDWLLALAADFLEALFGLFKDAVIWVIDGIAGAVIAMFGAIAVPTSLAGGMQSLFSGFPALALYVLGSIGFAEGLAMIGSAYGVRFIRKIVTLFQY